MEQRREALTAIIDRLDGRPPEMGNFAGRIAFQKRVYLLQELGLGLGYPFSWYVRGPYSSLLASDGFELHRNYTDLVQGASHLSNDQRVVIDQFRRLISGFEEPTRLEALASLHFLFKYTFAQHATFDQVSRSLTENKRRFLNQVEMLQDAWNRLRQFGLVPR